MFDARQILDALIGAAAIDPQAQRGGSGPQGQSAGQSDGSAGGFGGGLGDLLGKVLGGGQGNGQTSGQAGAGGSGLPGGLGGGGLGGGLGDLLGGLLGGGRSDAAPGGAASSGAPAPGQSGGIAGSLQDAISRMGGGQAGGLLQQAMAFAQSPKGAAILAGLAGLMLNKGGRTVSGSAAKLGGAALVGGLAYKAMQEWQKGSTPAQTQASLPAPAPANTAFAAESQTNDESIALVQAMIAAAAADGQVDEAERAKITGALGAALPKEAVDFLDASFANPLTPDQLAELATGPEHAAQIYAAARITIDPDAASEQQFLTGLQRALGLDDGLVAHLDAAAMTARA